MDRKNASLIEQKTEDEGEVTAYASVFDNLDRTNERVAPGAFTETLQSWRRSGREIPIVASHKWDDVWSIVGSAHPENVRETSRGLLVNGHLDIDTNPTAQQVDRLMKRGNLTGWSFGYEVKDSRRGRKGEKIITKVDLHKVGPCLVGANEEAQLVGVKSIDEPETESPDVDSMTDAELKDYSLGLVERTDTKSNQPIRIASFEC